MDERFACGSFELLLALEPEPAELVGIRLARLGWRAKRKPLLPLAADRNSEIDAGRQRRDREIDDAEGQVQPNRRDVPDAPALELFLAQRAGRSDEQPQRSENLAVDVQQLVRQLVTKVTDRRIRRRRLLPARFAVRPRERRAAVRACRPAACD